MILKNTKTKTVYIKNKGVVPVFCNVCEPRHEHPRSLISTFVVPCLESMILIVSISEISSL